MVRLCIEKLSITNMYIKICLSVVVIVVII